MSNQSTATPAAIRQEHGFAYVSDEDADHWASGGTGEEPDMPPATPGVLRFTWHLCPMPAYLECDDTRAEEPPYPWIVSPDADDPAEQLPEGMDEYDYEHEWPARMQAFWTPARLAAACAEHERRTGERPHAVGCTLTLPAEWAMLTVTEHDVSEGERASRERCPLALAAARTCGAKTEVVEAGESVLNPDTGPELRVRIEIPTDAPATLPDSRALIASLPLDDATLAAIQRFDETGDMPTMTVRWPTDELAMDFDAEPADVDSTLRAGQWQD